MEDLLLIYSYGSTISWGVPLNLSLPASLANLKIVSRTAAVINIHTIIQDDDFDAQFINI